MQFNVHATASSCILQLLAFMYHPEFISIPQDSKPCLIYPNIKLMSQEMRDELRKQSVKQQENESASFK